MYCPGHVRALPSALTHRLCSKKAETLLHTTDIVNQPGCNRHWWFVFLMCGTVSKSSLHHCRYRAEPSRHTHTEQTVFVVSTSCALSWRRRDQSPVLQSVWVGVTAQVTPHIVASQYFAFFKSHPSHVSTANKITQGKSSIDQIAQKWVPCHNEQHRPKQSSAEEHNWPQSNK